MTRSVKLVVAVLLLFFSVTAYAEYFIDINIPEYKLRLYEDDKLVKIYPIAVGRSITPSILGDFQIATKVKNPTWYPVGKEPV
ncbi:MAG TPA: L,D-transpeptidase, partial [Firmicutes bacterium]|nr:L,D-transpeptidase [Bacillota bacterium]